MSVWGWPGSTSVWSARSSKWQAPWQAVEVHKDHCAPPPRPGSVWVHWAAVFLRRRWVRDDGSSHPAARQSREQKGRAAELPAALNSFLLYLTCCSPTPPKSGCPREGLREPQKRGQDRGALPPPTQKHPLVTETPAKHHLFVTLPERYSPHFFLW